MRFLRASHLPSGQAHFTWNGTWLPPAAAGLLRSDPARAAALSTLVSGGVAFLGPARVKGRFALRACFTNLRTTRADVDLILEELLRVAEAGA